MPYYPLEHTHIAFSSKTFTMSFDDIVNLSKKLMSLIVKMHKLGYAHRDLKHNNVLVNTNWRYVLIDFGMVQFDPDLHQIDDSHVDYRSTANAAYCWRPPEQNFSRSELSKFSKYREIIKKIKNGMYSDSYVLGLMLLELVCGQVIFRPKNDEENGGLEQILGMMMYIDKDFCQSVDKTLATQKLSPEKICEEINLLNCSNFSNFDNASSWCPCSFR